MSQLFGAIYTPALDANGAPISGATWNFYDTGTTTPAAVYADNELNTSLGAVVTANSAGRFVPIYLDSVTYRAILKDASGNTIRDVDPINGDAGTQITLQQYGAACDGTTNDYAAIMAAHDNVPDGSTIYVQGVARFTSPLVFTRRLNWVCEGLGDYFKPEVGISEDALTIIGGHTAAGVDNRINMFSVPNSCANGLVLRTYFMSTIQAYVQVGAAGYSFKVLGALESRFYLRCSANWTTPLGSPQYGPNHLLIDVDGIYKTNASEFYLNFAGAVNGVICNNMSNEGNNVFRGTIQGLSGSPFTATGCMNLRICEMHLEANDASPALNACFGATIESVLNAASEPFSLNTCIGTTIQNYLGGLVIGSSSEHTKVVNCRLDGNAYIDLSSTTEMIGGGVTSSSGADSLACGGGASPIENIFENPFVDVWTAGAAAAPDGFAGTDCTFARSTSSVYGFSPSGVVVDVTSTATVLGNAMRAAPTTYGAVSSVAWAAVTIALRVATGQPNLAVYLFDGATYHGGETFSTKDAWGEVRLAAKLAAGANPTVVVIGFDGTNNVAANFRVGGVSIVRGTTAPKFLIDSGRRLERVVTSVSNTPAFVGQRALVGSTFYMAKGVASSADWVALN